MATNRVYHAYNHKGCHGRFHTRWKLLSLGKQSVVSTMFPIVTHITVAHSVVTYSTTTCRARELHHYIQNLKATQVKVMHRNKWKSYDITKCIVSLVPKKCKHKISSTTEAWWSSVQVSKPTEIGETHVLAVIVNKKINADAIDSAVIGNHANVKYSDCPPLTSPTLSAANVGGQRSCLTGRLV